jgi:predicted nucleic acid-binding protein
MPRQPGATYAISDTGPLISAFQSGSFDVLAQIFAEVHIPRACLDELQVHGWREQVQVAMPKLVIVELTSHEGEMALDIARQVAGHPDTNDPVVENHLGEAQAIVLALRAEYRDDLLLLDELVARVVAKEKGLKLSGFPGVLLLAVQLGLMSSDGLKTRLEMCRAQGTHYSVTFIERVYAMAKQEWRKT